ncbi:Rve domain-containing protein [Melia azedarach]|uniref:Rve domain-containing protein n=1 Tax=Melia azedarach TaxID=155640 RepID=A0ACC1XH94_MELAZ|nr:Rve domain-containing protein [Melia azedarach]
MGIREALAIITEKKTTDFIHINIVYRFGIPHVIIVDHGKQFDNKKFKNWCSELGIDLRFTSSTHPQANGQVEVTDKTIKKALKTKLDEKKGSWVDELPEVLWAYRTSNRIQRIARYYNKKVKARRYMEGDLVLRKVTLATRIPEEGAFGSNWEGPYRVVEAVRPRTYRLSHIDGKLINKSWNTDMLKKYYV